MVKLETNKKQKNPICKCGRVLKSLYSRVDGSFKFLNMFYCDKCNKIYYQRLTEKKTRELK